MSIGAFRMQFLARFGLACLFAIGLSGVCAPASAQEDREAARAEFERGRSAFEAGAFREALEHFQEAYRLAPHPNVRVNIANCYDQLDRPIEALVHYENFLVEADRPPAARRREVESAIARLRQRVGTITLQITPDGAQITIDGSEMRRAPVAEPVRVVSGSHTVVVELDGYRTERQTVVVEGGGNARLALRLQRATEVASAGGAAAGGPLEPAGSASTASAGRGSDAGTETGPVLRDDVAQTSTPSTQAGGTQTGGTQTGGTQTGGTQTGGRTEEAGLEPGAPTGGGLRITTPVLVTGAVTGAALVGTIVFGALALSSNGSFENAVVRTMDPALGPAELQQARLDGEAAASDARTFALVTDVMLIASLVGAGATTALFVIAQGESDQEDTVALVPIVAPGAAGLFASGRF
jgi:hypothetical protein